MPSVTEILDYLTEPELVRWIENNSKAKRKSIRDEALRVGTAVDLLVQQDIKEGGYLVPEGDLPIENCMVGWELFKKEHPEFVSSVIEMQIELKQGELVGHPDFVIENGIIDLKCSSGIRPKYWTQVAKYYDMRWTDKIIMENCGTIGIIRLEKMEKKEPKYEYILNNNREYINYEIEVFGAYYVAYLHAFKNREMIRQQLEEEKLQ